MSTTNNNSVVRYRDGRLTRIVSLVRMETLFERFGAEGLSTAEISARLGGKVTALSVMNRYPLLKAAYQRGIDGRTIDVEAAVLKEALGYTRPTEKRFRRIVGGVEVEETITSEETYYPPNMAAAKLILKGREAPRYGGGDDGKAAVTININGADVNL